MAPAPHRFVLSPDFRYALERMENGNDSCFITGRAGTGKSTLLQLFRRTTRKKCAVLAPTGIAALNVQGQTIHSFFSFPPRPLTARDIRRRRKGKLYQNLEALIIDEISMVRADLLDAIDRFLRLNRKDERPFGGVQMLFFGDLFQLPPVVASDAESLLFNGLYDSPFFFSAQVFQEGFSVETIELREVYRQENRHFLRLLEAIRLNRVDHDDLQELNDRYQPDVEPHEAFITLTATNAKADRINRQSLAAIPFPSRLYASSVTGDFNARLFPTEAVLELKLNAQVMFIKNDPDGAFVNGTLGRILNLEESQVTVGVKKENGDEEKVQTGYMEWEILRYIPSEKDPNEIETEVVGTFRQLPLRLAWAVTIHKAQGKTFDHVIIDLGRGAFENGQTYVALSRCRTLEGIVLRQPLRGSDIMTDERVLDFYQRKIV